jgi:YggT family protein
MQRRLMRAGANPVDAPLWLLGAVAVAGLLATGLVGWISASGTLLHAMRGAGPGAWMMLVINTATSLLRMAILIRGCASWLGAGRYNKLMRPVYFLTDWLVEPIARRLPPMGRIDLSPLIAYVLLLLLRSLITTPLR